VVENPVHHIVGVELRFIDVDHQPADGVAVTVFAVVMDVTRHIEDVGELPEHPLGGVGRAVLQVDPSGIPVFQFDFVDAVIGRQFGIPPVLTVVVPVERRRSDAVVLPRAGRIVLPPETRELGAVISGAFGPRVGIRGNRLRRLDGVTRH
jgi:hypothetical protein